MSSYVKGAWANSVPSVSTFIVSTFIVLVPAYDMCATELAMHTHCTVPIIKPLHVDDHLPTMDNSILVYKHLLR